MVTDAQAWGDATDVTFAVGSPAPLKIYIVDEQAAVVEADVFEAFYGGAAA